MGVKILSLYDGMACGMIAMQLAGVDVESYDAYEIDKYAIKTAQHNFPMIKEHGDVFGADFTQYEGVDFLIGGSPCTYWSIAQTKNRETVASGMGWELFSQYVRALHEAKPKYFIYENNKSMSKQIRASIDEAFGFEAVLINSALVSAQNRQRLYWVGRRNEDGTYSKVNVEQPADRGILLKDVLDNAVAMREKAHTIDANYYKGGNFTSPNKQSGKRLMAAEPINTDANGKAFCVTSRYYKGFGNNPGKCLEKHRDSMVAEPVAFSMVGDFSNRKVSVSDKAYCLAANPSSDMSARVAEPINITEDGKSQTLKAQYCKNSVANFCYYSSTYGASGVAEPINMTADGKAQCLRATCYKDGIRNIIANEVDKKTGVAEPINDIYQCANGGGAGAKTGLYAMPLDGFIPGERTVGSQMEFLGGISGRHEKWLEDGKNYSRNFSQGHRLYGVNGKAVTQTAQACGYAGNTGLYAIPYEIEFDDDGRPIKAIGKDGKEITIYEVKDGKITIKGKQYPIKLKDGYYIIRKLTVSECKRLQTVPEWYEFPVSNSAAYKMLGNGWTCEVICHLINSCFKPVDALPGQIGLWG